MFIVARNANRSGIVFVSILFGLALVLLWFWLLPAEPGARGVNASYALGVITLSQSASGKSSPFTAVIAASRVSPGKKLSVFSSTLMAPL